MQTEHTPRSTVRRILDLVRPERPTLAIDDAVFCANCRSVEQKQPQGLQHCTVCGTEGMLRVSLMLDVQKRTIEDQTNRLAALQTEIALLKKRLSDRPARMIGIVPSQMIKKDLL